MKEKLICIVTPTSRCYFQATALAKEFLDKEQNIIHSTGTIPDGEVTEFKVSSKTIKHYNNEKLDGPLQTIDLNTGKITFAEQYKNGQLVKLSTLGQEISDDTIQIDTPASRYRGTIVKTNKNTLSFYVDGKEVAEQTLSPQGEITEQLGAVPDGPVKEFDDKGALRMECTYANNLLENLKTIYDDKNRIQAQENYLHGKLNGQAKYYNYSLDGQAVITAHYKNALLEGEWVYAFPDGNPFIRSHYKNGKLQGESCIFYQTQQTHVKENYENGKLQGPRVIYFSEGNVWYQENYKDGRLDGERICFFHNGNKYSEEWYTEGLLDGPRKIYAENGQLLTQEEYHWGNLVRNTERASK